MRTYLLSAILVLVVALVPAQAEATVCISQSASSYSQLNGGCILQDGTTVFTLKNFHWSTRTDGNYVPVTGSQAAVTPTFNNGYLSVEVQSQNFYISGNTRLEAMFEYLVDPPPPILEDLNLDMEAFSPVAPGWAKITAIMCAGALLSNNCAGGEFRTLLVEHFGAGDINNHLSDHVTFTPTNFIDVRIKLEMDAAGASSQISGYKAFSSPIATPEPGAIWLMLGGIGALLGAGARRVRRRAKLEGLSIPLQLSSQV